jgi:hypothetical protein
MRIRKETSSLNWRYFVKVFAIVAVIYGIILTLDYVYSREVGVAVWINAIVYPFIFGAMYAYNQRMAKLFVNDYRDIPDFKVQLLEKLQKEGFELTHAGENTLALPTSRFRKFTQKFFGSEELSIQWGDEITISGTVNRVSWVEDVLTWNPAFRYALSAN